MLKAISDFLRIEIWRIRLDKLSKRKSLLIKNLRIIILSIRGFKEDECQLKASSLTFYSLLSIAPVLAMAFGVAKGFGFEKILENTLMEKLPGHEEIITQVIEVAHSILHNTRGGLIAGIGVGILVWTIFKVLNNIEKSFNGIWGVEKNRSVGRKLTDYLAVLVIGPVLFLVSSSITVFIEAQISQMARGVVFFEFAGPFIFIMLRLLPLGVMWTLFTFIYVFIPNTQVKLVSGLFGGIAAGTIYLLIQWVYITFQVGAARYNAIYGSFAAIPLFLIWLQISWIVVLLGAEISFAHQNVDTYEFEPDCLRVSDLFKRLLSIRIMEILVKNFKEGREPLTDSEISSVTDSPIRLVRKVLYDLVDAGIVSEVNTGQYKQIAYQPGRDIENMRISDIIEGLDKKGSEDVPIDDSPETEKIRAILGSLSSDLKNSSHNMVLKDI